MDSGRNKVPLYRRLTVRIVLFLSIALLPVGLISVIQTWRVTSEAQANTELTLMTMTEKAVFDEQLAIEHAFGAAEALSTFSDLFSKDPDACRRYLKKYISISKRYIFAGFMPPSRVMTCSSSAETLDYSDNPRVEELMKDERPTVRLNDGGPDGKSPIITVSQPFFIGRKLRGFVVVSMPHKKLQLQQGNTAISGLVALATFTADGTVLTSTDELQKTVQELPPGVSPVSLTRKGRRAFSASNSMGEPRTYTVVPIIDGTVYALGIWNKEKLRTLQSTNPISPALFPLLMWLTSLLVAIFAVHRLVLRHVRRLGRQMRRFARDRHLADDPQPGDMSAELMEMQADFTEMAHGIMADEAELEDMVRSKNVLIKEVHHRVKNNLQLIASIMNIQIRNTKNPETKAVVQRLQDRVLSLATIHRDLYQSQDVGRVNVGLLLREIISKNLDIANDNGLIVASETDIDDIPLYPDQAVPLSLLASEAINNAIKYLAPDANGKTWMNVSLKDGDDGYVVLTISNSTDHQTDLESTGLGSMLTRAFVRQLGAEQETDAGPDNYTIVVRFRAMDFAPESVDF